jgi:hypothetical protein
VTLETTMPMAAAIETPPSEVLASGVLALPVPDPPYLVEVVSV